MTGSGGNEMFKIRLFSATGISVLAVVTAIAGFVGWLLGPFPTVDQPIIISDGSMYIERKDGGKISDWKCDNTNHPNELYPDQAWEGLDVFQDGNNVFSCPKTETQCTIDIKYDRQTASIHFKYNRGDSHPMVIASDNNAFDSWSGYKGPKMSHPIPGKIKAVNGQTYSGVVEIKIHHTASLSARFRRTLAGA
jgi:hypothetical protein